MAVHNMSSSLNRHNHNGPAKRHKPWEEVRRDMAKKVCSSRTRCRLGRQVKAWQDHLREWIKGILDNMLRE